MNQQEIRQQFNDDDFVVIKEAMKNEKTKQNNRQQIPVSFFTLFAAMGFISYLNGDMFSMLLFILGCIVCMVGIYYVNYYDQKGIAMYRFIFARCLFPRILFHDKEMHCIDQNENIINIPYNNVTTVFELQSMLILKCDHKEVPYVFILKRNLANCIYDYLHNILQNRWKHVENKPFRLA